MTTVLLAALAAITLIGLIGVTTFIAFDVISNTVSDQLRANDLQLVTSLSQQGQASLTSLESEVAGLALREEIRATSVTREEDALALLAERAEDFPEGAVLSMTRFDFRGNPRYAYPPDHDAIIQDVDGPDEYFYQIPNSLLEQTERGQRVTSEIDIRLVTVSHRDRLGGTTLLIAPVDTVSLDTEFLAVELDMANVFQDLYGFVELQDSGQLWVLSSTTEVVYQAQPEPSFEPILDQIPSTELFARSREPYLDTYENQGARLAAIARAPGLGQSFILFLSRDESETQEAIQNNMLGIFGFAVAAMLFVITIGSAGAWQINRVNEARRREAQRQQTGRILLEVSRALNSSLELETVLQAIMRELERLVPHDSASILLIEPDGLRVAASRGIAGDTVGSIIKVENARAAGLVLEQGRPVIVNNTEIDERWAYFPDDPIHSWIGLPLLVRDELVGVLNINSHSKDSFSREDTEVAEAFADQASVALQNARLHEIEVQQYEQELTIARNIQTSLLPDQPPQVPQIEVATRSLPARQVSGDYFQYLPMPDGKVGIAIGDVQGKGIPAALLMAVITTAMRDEAIRHQEPADLLQALNTRLLERMQRNHMNSALIMATFDPQTSELNIANGGMVQPYIRPTGETQFDFVSVGGYPLGVSGNMKYTSKQVPFQTGSMMVMFSDGVLEAQNPAGEFLGFDRIEQLLNELPDDISAQEVMEHIYSAVQTHLAGEAPQDDTTIMVIRAMPVPESDIPQPTDAELTAAAEAMASSLASAHPESTTIVGQSQQFEVDDMSLPAVVSSTTDGMRRKQIELYLPSKLGFEKIARGAIESLAREFEAPEDKIEDLKTAVAEACMNAIEHGNAEDMQHTVSVVMIATAESIEVRVTDRGVKTLAMTLPEPGQGDMRGWGLFFIENLMDVFEIKHLPDGGNQVLMVVHIKPNGHVDTHAEMRNNGGHSANPVDSAGITGDTTHEKNDTQMDEASEASSEESGD
ncbi:MAG: SpoIIE family protein phosphatase [Anaerolineales bacterium]